MSLPIWNSINDMLRELDFTIESSYDEKRVLKAWDMYTTRYRGDGCFGCIRELLNTGKSNNKKYTVSEQNENDNYIRYSRNNKRGVPYAVETKTNGGRVKSVEKVLKISLPDDTEEEILLRKEEYIKGYFVAYTLDICNKNTGYNRWFCHQKLFRMDFFKYALNELNGVKAMYKKYPSGIRYIDGYGIQCNTKTWFEFINSYPLEFKRGEIYTEKQFEIAEKSVIL